jgi:AbrB family transcriptional regulator (stage V sporulation protein T)
MKATGLVRKLDDLGRVVIPMEIRRLNGWEAGTPLEMFTGDDGAFIVRKFNPPTEEKNTVIKNLIKLQHLTDDPISLTAIKEAIDFVQKK